MPGGVANKFLIFKQARLVLENLANGTRSEGPTSTSSRGENALASILTV